jgi:elongation factor P
MIDVNQLRKGTTYNEDGELLKVISYHHHKPGRGAATIRVTVRNLRTGSTTEKTYNSGSRVQDIRMEATMVEFLYEDGDFLTFMDNETFEQPQLSKSTFGDDVYFIKEGLTLKLLRYEGELIDYELPDSVEFEVADSEMAVAGDTANNPTKKVITETGLEVTVPMFVKVGDFIKVKTEDASYVTRV